MYKALFQRSLLSAVLASASCTVIAAGVIEGRISDYSGGVYFDGATVSLGDTRLTAVAAQGGRFRFTNVPAGQYQLRVAYEGAAPVEQTVVVVDDAVAPVVIKIGADVAQIENVLVIGQAAGVLSAINQMRGADNVVSIVSADAIGQLPDDNVSEALQRISGVFIERDQGEGRFVGVRGIDPQLNVATVNGLNLPSPEGDRRNVALDVIPSDLVESLEVIKTLTPDQDGDAIGGTINVKSLSAFDRDGLSYKLSGQYYYNDLENDDGYKLAARLTNVFALAGGELGVAISVSSNERNFGTETIEADGAWSTLGGVRFHDNFELRNFQITRKREGVAMNVDFRPDDNHSYYLRTLYSKFTDEEFRNRIEFKFDEDDIVLTPTSLIENKAELERELKDRYEAQEIYSILVGGESHVGDWTLDYSAGFSEASEDEPRRIDIEFENKKIATAGYSGFGPTPQLSYSADGLDGDIFKLKEITLENNATSDEEAAFKLDVTRAMTVAGHHGYIKLGAKFRRRDKTSDLNARTFEDFDTALGRDFFLSEFSAGNVNYDLATYGPAISPAAVRGFVSNNLTRFIEDGDAGILDSARDYRISEDVTALYAMSRVDIDAWRLVYGLRYEKTDFKAAGFNVSAVDVGGLPNTVIAPNRFAKSYSNVLPSVNVRYQAGEHLILRGAYSHSIARPSFGDLNPTPAKIDIEEDGADIELKVEAGNPELEPYESQNIDFALEYYPEKLGIFAAGVFFKRIDNFIFDADVTTTARASDFAGAIAVTKIKEVIKPLNGDTAELYGIELGWTRHFDDLPSPFDGLLLQLNATFTDSEADLGLPIGAGRSNRSNLPLQADTVANFVVGYERRGLSLRLASAYVSERLIAINLADASNDEYEDAHQQWDFTAKYNVTDAFQLFFSALNLSEEPQYRFYGTKQFNSRYDEVGRSFVLGLSYRNL